MTELLIAIAILAVVLSLSAPSFQNFMAKSRLSASSSQIRAALGSARSEAIKTNRRVTVCAGDTQSGCSDASWSDGSIAFVDGDVKGEVDEGDEIIKVYDSVSPLISLLLLNINGSVSFTSDGASDASGAFLLCDQAGRAEPGKICVSLSGAIANGIDACIEHVISCPA